MFTPVPPETPRLRESFNAKWRPDGECHRWIGFRRSKEYGGFQIGYRTFRAHRVAYVWRHGEPNCDLHHTCGNAWCVNPDHITPASAHQPHHRSVVPGLCAQGHEFDGVNARGERTCSICLRAAVDRHYEANREQINAKKRERRERVVYDERPCPVCGLLFTPKRSTGRFCDRRECVNERQRLNRLRRLGR